MTRLNKIRTQQIVLDMPTEDAEVWVRATLQKVIKDESYQTVQTIDRVGHLHRQFNDFALQIIEATDPVTGDQITISGAGLGLIIGEFVCAWMLADLKGATENEHGDILI